MMDQPPAQTIIIQGEDMHEGDHHFTLCGLPNQPVCPPLPKLREVPLSRRVLAYGVLSIGDFVTTEIARKEGAGEGNPLMGNRAVRIGLEALSTLGSAKLDQIATKKGKKKLLFVGRFVIGVGSALIIRENLHVADLQRRENAR